MKKINIALLISLLPWAAQAESNQDLLSVTVPSTIPLAASSASANNETAVNNQKMIQAMRINWRNNFIPTADINPQLLSQYIAQLNHNANDLWQKMNKDGNDAPLWSDMALDDHSSAGRLNLGSTLNTLYQRLFVLTKAYATPGTDLYHNPQLKHTLINTLTWLNQHYYHQDAPEWGNWWHWELGISRTLNNILIILYDDIPTELISAYNQATRHFVKDPRYLAEGSGAPYSTTKNAFTSTGGNRIDSAQVVFIRGLLANDSQEITNAVNSLPEVLDRVTSGDGFYADGSFIQHKDLPYNGTYGQVLLNGLGLIKRTVTNTPWDFSAADNLKIYQTINRSYLPLLYQGKMIDAVNGRSISRHNGQDLDVGLTMINAIALFVDGAPTEQKIALEKQLKSQLRPAVIQHYQAKLPDNLAAWKVINRLIHQDLPEAKIPLGGTVYADMDRVVYHGNHYMSVIAMHSNRTGSYECINGENLKGQRTADGMTYIYQHDDNQYTGYWPVVDARYLPGTTSAGELGSCDEQYRLSQLGHANITWAGGVTLDQWASASLELKVPQSSLTAKKSWFMAPDIMVMLGTDISAQQPVVTTLDNRKITATSQIEVDGKPLHSGEQVSVKHTVQLVDGDKKMRWELNGAQPVTAQWSLRQGDWSEIGTSSSPVSAPFLTLLNSHASSDNESYAYTIYPTGADSVPFNLLANDKSVQAIQFSASQTVMANFWRPSQAGIIEALTPLALIITPVGNDYRIAVASPRRDSRVSFRLPETLQLKTDPDSRITLQNGIISVDVSQLRGSSYLFELQK